MTESIEITGVAAMIWYAAAIFTVVTAVLVVTKQNIVHAAFQLLFTLMGVAVLYLFAAADFIAVVQVMLYVGGVLVLLLFAVMLTQRIGDPQVASQSLGRVRGALITLLVGGLLWIALTQQTQWPQGEATVYEPTTRQIGHAFLNQYLLPFEVASVLLLAAIIGAVVIARREVRGGEGEVS